MLMAIHLNWLLVFACSFVIYSSLAVAQVLPDLDECRNKGVDAGEGVARAACLSLTLRCPLTVRKADSHESVPFQRAYEVLQGVLRQVALDSCTSVFQNVCEQSAVAAVLDLNMMPCLEILSREPPNPIPGCMTFTDVLEGFEWDVRSLCQRQPEILPELAPNTPSDMMLQGSKEVQEVKEVIVSRDRPTYQSTTLFGLGSRNAIDGRPACTHTGFTKTKLGEVTNNPWWSVDLGAPRKITRIIIQGRKDCCGDRLSNFEIRIGNARPLGDGKEDASQMNNLCQSGLSVRQGQTKEFSCKMKGRYVTIRIPGKRKILSLCNVEVYAEDDSTIQRVEDVILSSGKPTFQSSTLWYGFSSRAVDGKKNTVFDGRSCTHTGLGPNRQESNNPWWTVDLQSSQKISGVRITTRSDCCHKRIDKFEIRVGDVRPRSNGDQNNVCRSSLSIPRGETYQFDCNARGRYVTIRVPRWTILTLCEVEVLG